MIFEDLVQRLIDLGFYKFVLPFIIISAIIYALLRKNQVLGDSPVVNGIVAISFSFFVFALPILAGMSLEKPLSSFFGQVAIVIMIIAFTMIITGMFVPNLTGVLTGGSGMIWWMLIIVLVLALGSGLFFVVINPIAQSAGGGGSLVLIVFLLILFMILAAQIKGGK